MPHRQRKLRLLHTGDWHLGIRLGRHDRRPDTTHALNTLVERAETVQPDVILHAGDVFHHERPPQTAVEDAVDILTRLAQIAPVVIAAGNHDGKRLLRSVNVLAREGTPQRLIIASDPDVITVNTDGAGRTPCVVAAIPWISAAESLASAGRNNGGGTDPELPPHPQRVAETIRETTERARATARDLVDGGPAPVVLLAHTHLKGAVVGEALRELSVSDTYAVDPSELPRVDYCALGHIHDRQDVKTRPGLSPAVYSGSVIRTTFGEHSRPKSAELVELTLDNENGGAAEWTVSSRVNLELPATRPLYKFEGPWPVMAALLDASELRNTILSAAIRTPDRMYDLVERITGADPSILIHNLRNEVDNPDARDAALLNFDEVTEPPLDEMYRQWREERLTPERGSDDAAVALFNKAIAALDGHTADPFGIETLQQRFDAIMQRLAEKSSRRARSEPTSSADDPTVEADNIPTAEVANGDDQPDAARPGAATESMDLLQTATPATPEGSRPEQLHNTASS